MWQDVCPADNAVLCHAFHVQMGSSVRQCCQRGVFCSLSNQSIIDEHSGCWSSSVYSSFLCSRGLCQDFIIVGYPAGFESVSVLVHRPHMAPVRCGFWRSGSPKHLPQALPLYQPEPPSQPLPQIPSELQSETQPQPEAISGAKPSAHSDASGPLEASENGSEGLSAESSQGNLGLSRKGSEGRPPKHRPAPGPAVANAPIVPVSFVPDVLLAAVEPFGAQLLELRKLNGFRGKIGYSPTRNRQCHTYTITERPNARSAPLKRVFLRYALHDVQTDAIPMHLQEEHELASVCKCTSRP